MGSTNMFSKSTSRSSNYSNRKSASNDNSKSNKPSSSNEFEINIDNKSVKCKPNYNLIDSTNHQKEKNLKKSSAIYPFELIHQINNDFDSSKQNAFNLSKDINLNKNMNFFQVKYFYSTFKK